MDSLSRPPHRRKLSSATNAFSSSFSLKNPYDDVLLSNSKSFAVHDYSEIFSGSSSSIPVLDLSPLDQSDSRTSAKLDYSNIFAAFRNDDVAVPYENLFNASSNQATQRSPADDRSHLQEADSPAMTKRSSGETSDQSVDGVKKHFNLSFNKTSQVNSDISNGKTHVAQLHAVPGFAFFVDGTPMPQKTEEEKPVTSLKREVSRTWSFSAEVEEVKSKGRLNLDKPHQSEKSRNVNEHNLKTHPSNVPSPSSRLPSLNDSIEFKRSRVSNFVSKEDASGKISSEETSPLLEEELDENSVAAVSAAALKKAIDQAQESIRIAKMIMERKTEGLRDGTKARSKGRSKAKDKKETRIDNEAYDSNDSNAMESSRRSTGANGPYASSLSRGDKIISAGKVEVEKVRENVEEAKEHREGIIRVGRHFSPSFSPNEALHFGEKIESDKQGDESNYLNQPASPPVEMDNGMKTLEQGDVTLYHTEGPEVVTELAENTFNSPQRMQESEKSVTGTSDQSQVTVIRSKISEIVTGLVGRVLNTSQITKDHGIVDQEITGKENEMVEERDNSTIDKDKFDRVEPDKKSQETGEIVNQEEVSGFISLLNEPQNLAGKEALDQENMMKKSEYVSDCRENDHKLGKSYVGEEKETRQIEGHLWFESEQHLKEDMEEEIIKSYPEVFSDTREAEEKVNETYEPEIDDNERSHTHQGDGQNLPNELEQIEERDMNTFVYEATETIEMESNIHAKVNKTAIIQDAEETSHSRITKEEETSNSLITKEEETSNSLITKEEETSNSLNKKEEETSNSPRGGNESEENQSDSEEAPYEKDKYEAIDADSDDSCTTISETQESCSDGFNNGGEENQKEFQCNKDDCSVPEMHETNSAINKNKTAEQLFDMGGTEIPAADFLRRSASEENFVGSKLYDTFNGFSSDEKEDNVGVIDPNQEEKLPKDDDKLKTDESHDGSEEYASRLAEFHPSDDKIPEVDFVDERHGSEQTSASDEELLSTSSHENVDELSANESPDCEEYTEDQTSEMEKVKGVLEMTSNETKCVDEQDDVYSEEKSESMETEGSVETVQNIEKDKDNLSGPSAIQEKDVKENVHDFDKSEHQQRIEAIKKGREREKDRLVVERAIREARERAFAEARERAERAAVEKAAAEVRRRALAEAKEKLEKLNAEAKIKAGRAAVERATTEARERALEKAMSHQTANEAKTQTASSSRHTVLKHSFSSSDIEKIDGTNTESAQRQKARLEKQQRIMERVAKALAEKNQRDLIAQQDQAERHRISESLDSDIKRWASGKEGNLRALLSTLQYILGSESGWKPVSLTEILTTAAVKKAYRKATLYVHPDKLQQRGASIQQKYICEKVFDLLKAAWNRFNSEER